ncbi:hypothetical protein BJY04DRAFT_212435 [Aspergillus karnatakaensis]|uniref:uncharacterized protein n=1 Tax=Aspergillus karnatakaensis TaxID=1810916 RepID=UPI003CCD2D66
MKIPRSLILLAAFVIAVHAAPLGSAALNVEADADEAVVYPARVNQSWVNVEARNALPSDADEAVVYPAKVDQSWVNAEV